MEEQKQELISSDEIVVQQSLKDKYQYLVKIKDAFNTEIYTDNLQSERVTKMTKNLEKDVDYKVIDLHPVIYEM